MPWRCPAPSSIPIGSATRRRATASPTWKNWRKNSPYFDKKDPEALQLRHDMMRAKIAAYTQGQSATSRLFRKAPDSLAANMATAMAIYLSGNLADAMKKADALAKAQPNNPYFQELRGDVLMKANKPKQAAEAYSKAVKLDPAKSGILRIALARR